MEKEVPLSFTKLNANNSPNDDKSSLTCIQNIYTLKWCTPPFLCRTTKIPNKVTNHTTGSPPSQRSHELQCLTHTQTRQQVTYRVKNVTHDVHKLEGTKAEKEFQKTKIDSCRDGSAASPNTKTCYKPNPTIQCLKKTYLVVTKVSWQSTYKYFIRSIIDDRGHHPGNVAWHSI